MRITFKHFVYALPFILLLITIAFRHAPVDAQTTYQVSGRVVDIGASPTPPPNTCPYNDGSNTYTGLNNQVVELNGVTNQGFHRMTVTAQGGSNQQGAFYFNGVPGNATYKLCYDNNARQSVSFVCTNGTLAQSQSYQECVTITLGSSNSAGNRFFLRQVAGGGGNTASGQVFDVTNNPPPPNTCQIPSGEPGLDGQIMSIQGINNSTYYALTATDLGGSQQHGAFYFHNLPNDTYWLCHPKDTERPALPLCPAVNDPDGPCKQITINNSSSGGNYFYSIQPSNTPTPTGTGPTLTPVPTSAGPNHVSFNITANNCSADGISLTRNILYTYAAPSPPVQVDVQYPGGAVIHNGEWYRNNFSNYTCTAGQTFRIAVNYHNPPSNPNAVTFNDDAVECGASENIAINCPAATQTPIPTATTGPTNTPNPQCPLQPQGDANCDGTIDDADYQIWQQSFMCGHGKLDCPTVLTADFNGDSAVDLLDFEIWRFNFFARQVTPGVTTVTPVPGQCRVDGAGCAVDTDCCSGLFCKTAPGADSGVCSPIPTTTPGSCLSRGQVCTVNSQCCSNNCVINPGASSGTCGIAAAGTPVP